MESYTGQQARDIIQKQLDLDPGMPGQWFTVAVELKATRVLAGHVALISSSPPRPPSEKQLES